MGNWGSQTPQLHCDPKPLMPRTAPPMESFNSRDKNQKLNLARALQVSDLNQWGQRSLGPMKR